MLSDGPVGGPDARWRRCVAPIAGFLLEFGAVRPLLDLPGELGPSALLLVWGGAALGLVLLMQPTARELVAGWCGRRWLAGLAVPMTGVAIAGLWSEPVEVWSGANLLLDGVVLAAYWVTSRWLPLGPQPAPRPPPG